MIAMIRNTFGQIMGQHGAPIGSFGFGLAVLVIISILVIPMPSALLDAALAFSFVIAMLILLIALSISKPLDFSSLPTLLLFTTLLRLSLNIATTRLILSHGGDGPGSAGRVVAAFGGFLMGGDVAVGVIIFLMVLLVNFTVITKGASRIAEVSARFYLDSMPGRQMAIDADLGSGLIDESIAQSRRTSLAEECGFYGAMDGASKFVRGDAICALIMALVNIIGGLSIGMIRSRLSFADAVSTFTTLTIGDGLVSQIPAIFVSTAAAVAVAKGNADEEVHVLLKRQLGTNFGALAITSCAAGALTLLPGLPIIPFLLISIFMATLAYKNFKITDVSDSGCDVADQSTVQAQPFIRSLEPLRVELGFNLLYLAANEIGQLPEQIKRLRRTLANELGFVMPPVNIQDSCGIDANSYSVYLKNIFVGGGNLRPFKMLAISAGENTSSLQGEETLDPTFGLSATWIAPDLADNARVANWTVVDLPTVITTHLAEIVQENILELFGSNDTQKLLTNVPEDYQKFISDTSPTGLSLANLHRLLQALLFERVSIRDLPLILEAAHEYTQANTRSSISLLTHVRARLSRQISEHFLSPDGYILAIVLSSVWDQTLTNSLVGPPEDRHLALQQEQLTEFIDRIRLVFDTASLRGEKPVLITNRLIRFDVYSLLDRMRLNISVIGQNEVHRRVKIKIIGIV